MKRLVFLFLISLTLISAPTQAQDIQALIEKAKQAQAQQAQQPAQKETSNTKINSQAQARTETFLNTPSKEITPLSSIEKSFHNRRIAEHQNYDFIKQFVLHSEPKITHNITSEEEKEILRKELIKELKKDKKKNTSIFDKKEKAKFTNQDILSVLEENDSLKKEQELTPIIQFGYNVFDNPLQQQNDLNIPVGTNYILGTGDELTVRIWGKLEETIEVVIEKNGKAYIPKVGYLSLTGVTFGEAPKVIKNALEKHYVNFEVNVSMSKLKTIKVFILGHVKQPGAYDISSLSTLFMALYSAGGPTKTGTLRNVQLKRNNTIVKSVDLYDYLLKGNSSQDIALKSYDTIFVPAIDDVILIEGDVKQPGIFELNQNTSVYDALIVMAGGIHATAYEKHIQIERVQNQDYKTVLDISFHNSEEVVSKIKKIALQNGDRIHIFSINKEKRNVVTIEGNIQRPGEYQLEENMSLAQLIDKASGIKSDSFTQRVEVYRYISDNQRKVMFKNIDTPSGNAFLLQEWDIIKVLTNQEAKGKESVYIEGAVQEPGEFQLLHEMRISDLIFLAKLAPYSDYNNAEFYRKNSDGKEELISLDLEDILTNPNSPKNLTLKMNDRIYIRHNVKATKLKKITLSGEVKYPGIYLARDGEKLSSIIKRAGGYTEDAFLKGANFQRKSVKELEAEGHTQVLEEEKKRLIYDQRRMGALNNENQFVYSGAIQFLQNRIDDAMGRVVIKLQQTEHLLESRYDIEVEDEDTLHIPKTPVSVQIVGGVQHPTSLIFEPSKGYSYYIKQAGGYSEFGKQGKILVFKADGTILKNPKTIERGDTIYVPEKIKVTTNWLSIFTEITQILFNVLTSLKITGVI